MIGKFVAIITAGGCGKRLQSKVKKQFIEINGRPLLSWTIDPFYLNNDISTIIVVLPEQEINIYRTIFKQSFPDKEIMIIAGGKERQESVFNALKRCPVDTDYVLIHDGVRPFINQSDLNKLMEAAVTDKAVIPVSPVIYTIKKVKNNVIESTVDRRDLFNALTPQVFAFDLISTYHDMAVKEDHVFTDDASILEYFGHTVRTVETDPGNFKITTRIDLALAEILLTKNLEK